VVLPVQFVPTLIAALQENLRIYSESHAPQPAPAPGKACTSRPEDPGRGAAHPAALEKHHPNADTELAHRNAFELLVATILSAQSTDRRVNEVTPALFKRYPDARALAKADPEELEALIHSTGFFRQKTRALVGMSHALVTGHGGEVQKSMDALTALPGVGRKTANVVLGHALGVPGLPVDRHVLRVTNRLGLVHSDDPVKVEAALGALIPKKKWTQASDTFILHGRRICKPTPQCRICFARPLCDYAHR
jgi:endonuclease-3